MPSRFAKTVLLLLSFAASSGCSVWETVRQVTVIEPKLFHEPTDEEASLATYRAMADEAWADSGLACPADCLAGDYAWGFREGFAQFVYAGGTGDPPVTPPRPYWQLDVRSGPGADAIRSWFEGYRHGARLARDGGYRRRATLAVSALLTDLTACDRTEQRKGSTAPDEIELLEPVEPVGPELTPEPAEPTEVVVPPAANEVTPEPSTLPSPTADWSRRIRAGRRAPVLQASELSTAPPSFQAVDGTNNSLMTIQTAMFRIVK